MEGLYMTRSQTPWICKVVKRCEYKTRRNGRAEIVIVVTCRVVELTSVTSIAIPNVEQYHMTKRKKNKLSDSHVVKRRQITKDAAQDAKAMLK